jgi:tetratricopeptide (TPR) repeat protein
MQFNKKWFPVLLLVVLVAGYFLFIKKAPRENSGNTAVATSTNNTVTSAGGNYTIEQIPTEVSVPDLNRKVVFGSTTGYDEVTKKVIVDKIIGIQAELKKNSKDLSKWLDLGIYQKMAGDYEGAVISWKYVASVSSDYVALGNLGYLYAYYLNDKNLSVTYYNQAIKNGPTQVYLYTQLAEVYRDVFKDVSKARAIIEEGLKKVPNDNTLLQFKANL